DMVRRSQLRHGQRFSLQVTDSLDALGPEQLKASRMHAAEQYEWQTSVELNDVGCNEGHADVDRPRSEPRVYVRRRQLDILDVGEPLAPQQLFRDVLRRNADARNLPEPDGRGLRRRLLSGHLSIEQASDRGQRECCE